MAGHGPRPVPAMRLGAVLVLAAVVLAGDESARPAGRRRARGRRPSRRSASSSSSSGRAASRANGIHEPTLNQRSTADDLFRLGQYSCRRLTVELLNGLDPKVCTGLTAACLCDFDATDLNAECLMNVSHIEFPLISAKTFRELVSSQAENMFFSQEDLYDLVHNNCLKFDRFPTTFVAYCASHKAYADPYIRATRDQGHFPALHQILASPHLEQLDPCMLTVLEERAVRSLPAATLSRLSVAQFGGIEPRHISKLTAPQIAAIPPGHFGTLVAETLFYLDRSGIEAITAAQARHLGADPGLLPAITATGGAERELQVFRYRQFVEGHACVGAKERLHNFVDRGVRDAIEQRCAPIWKTPSALRASIAAKRSFATVSGDWALVPPLTALAALAAGALLMFI